MSDPPSAPPGAPSIGLPFGMRPAPAVAPREEFLRPSRVYDGGIPPRVVNPGGLQRADLHDEGAVTREARSTAANVQEIPKVPLSFEGTRTGRLDGSAENLANAPKPGGWSDASGRRWTEEEDRLIAGVLREQPASMTEAERASALASEYEAARGQRRNWQGWANHLDRLLRDLTPERRAELGLDTETLTAARDGARALHREFLRRAADNADAAAPPGEKVSRQRWAPEEDRALRRFALVAASAASLLRGMAEAGFNRTAAAVTTRLSVFADKALEDGLPTIAARYTLVARHVRHAKLHADTLPPFDEEAAVEIREVTGNAVTEEDNTLEDLAGRVANTLERGFAAARVRPDALDRAFATTARAPEPDSAPLNRAGAVDGIPRAPEPDRVWDDFRHALPGEWVAILAGMVRASHAGALRNAPEVYASLLAEHDPERTYLPRIPRSWAGFLGAVTELLHARHPEVTEDLAAVGWIFHPGLVDALRAPAAAEPVDPGASKLLDSVRAALAMDLPPEHLVRMARALLADTAATRA